MVTSTATTDAAAGGPVDAGTAVDPRPKGRPVQRHALSDRKDDLYETPTVAVRALLEAEHLPAQIWEPACGPGAIVRVLRGAGHQVFASDLVERGCPDSTCGIDFLMETKAPAGVEAIITNPPYKLAAEFVAKGLDLVPYVAMLLRLSFLESARRALILDGGNLARVHAFANRLPMMHRAGWDGPTSTSNVVYAWFIWHRYHQGPATVDRLTWAEEAGR
jgi:hypothetical protein